MDSPIRPTRTRSRGAAFVDLADYTYGWSNQEDLYARAMQRAEQALALNPDQATAHFAKADLIMFKATSTDPASANQVIAEAEAALRADPSFVNAYLPMAVGESFGVTFGGGADNYGTVFEIAKSTGALTTIATFTGANGVAEP